MGAKKIYAFASHGLFNDPACEVIANSCIVQVIVTNSIPLSDKVKNAFPDKRVIQVSCGPLIAEAV